MIDGGVRAEFWKTKKVFLTGHTGFKGAWLTFWLKRMGASVCGYALAPTTTPSLYDILQLRSYMDESHIADIRDFNKLKTCLSNYQPDIVIHMAAQPLVRYSYSQPVETYEVNVLGTVYLLEALRSLNSVKATVIVTTDKCYENNEQLQGYQESDSLGGYDPYSSSKACAELVTSAYRRSFFMSSSDNAIASARAGNVIGGGDWSDDRLIPDALRAYENEQPLILRNPSSTRPWQHVLEPLSGYLILLQALYESGKEYGSAWNFGPDDVDNRSVEEVVNLLYEYLGSNIVCEHDKSFQPHEAKLLKLDCNKAKLGLEWYPRWRIETAIEKIAQWHLAYKTNHNIDALMADQIREYENASKLIA